MSEHAELKDDHGVHISPNSMYFIVFAALAVLTVLTWYVSRFHFGPFNDVIALGIAFTKASLVVLFFMHVIHSSRLTKMIVVAALVWLGLMMGLTIIDYVSRERVVPDPREVPSSLTFEMPAATSKPAESH
jgi:cytochrome c oxidase subunit 4